MITHTVMLNSDVMKQYKQYCIISSVYEKSVKAKNNNRTFYVALGFWWLLWFLVTYTNTSSGFYYKKLHWFRKSGRGRILANCINIVNHCKTKNKLTRVCQSIAIIDAVHWNPINLILATTMEYFIYYNSMLNSNH